MDDGVVVISERGVRVDDHEQTIYVYTTLHQPPFRFIQPFKPFDQCVDKSDVLLSKVLVRNLGEDIDLGNFFGARACYRTICASEI